jgi:hypothetical protein
VIAMRPFSDSAVGFWVAYIAIILTIAIIATAIQPGGPF